MAERRFAPNALRAQEAAPLTGSVSFIIGPARRLGRYYELKVWKETALSTDTLAGVADYVIAPNRAYMATPLLCVAEAKKDDFERGQAQCLAEMVVCQWNNRQRGYEIEVYGIVSNGQVWQFYRLTQINDVYESTLYTVDDLPDLLGALDSVCGECAKNVRALDGP